MVNDQIKRIQSNQATIDTLLMAGAIILKNNLPKESPGQVCDKWKLDIISQKSDVSIGFASCNAVSVGDFPTHTHPLSKEILVCVRGSVMFYYKGEVTRLLKVGDVAVIEAGATHYSKPVECPAKLLYICIPADKCIPDCFSEFIK